jgi:D-alanyl-D-alanine carboxypeptidase
VTIERLQQDLDDLVERGAISALAHVRTARADRVMASGTVTIGGSEPVDPAGYFRIGSVTKTYTAAAVMLLVGDGKLALDDTVEQWLPGVVPGGAAISVRRLIDHTSGLYNYTDAWKANPGAILEAQAMPPAAVVADAVARPVRFAPGASIAYDNTGFLLAGMVIEAASGVGYEDYVADRILRPLGLDQTVVRMDRAIPEPHAHGYLGEQDMTTFDRTAAGAAGGIVSTAADVNRFFAALLGGDLLAALERAEMIAPTPWADPYRAGLGLLRMTLGNGVEVIGKDGDFFGYDTISFHTLTGESQLTLTVTTDCDVSFDTSKLLDQFGYVFEAAA